MGEDRGEGVPMIGALELAAALLLAAAGAAKLVAPGPAAAMLRRAVPPLARNLRAVPAVVRVGGAAELAIGIGVAVTGSRWSALLLALAYAAFAVVAARLIRLGTRQSCGCFGRTDSPVGRPHVALNLAALAVAIAAVVRPAGPAGGLFDHGALAATVGLAQAGLLAYLGFLSITALPALAAARRQVTA
jgi:methylamine utilization protein MauE